MTENDKRVNIIGHKAVARSRLQRSVRRLSEQLQQLSQSLLDIQAYCDHVRLFLEHQHQHFQEVIDRTDDLESFCSRCQQIMDGNDADQMARERDWLIAGYRKRNAHRRPWLDRLGLLQ